MFPFSRERKDTPETPAPAAPKAAEAHPLDALTGGAFSAATSGERAARIRAWLVTEPTHEQMQEVYKELAAKDKGAAKALREKLDELKRARHQDALAAEWAAKAEALLQAARLNVADALAWQRDAARAGAPLSREPLAGLRSQLAERIKTVEDLQQRVMVQREAAVLLAQRIELLSTKPWRDADAAQAGLETDVAHWREQSAALQADAQWGSVDMRYPPQIEAAQAQLAAVWDAFGAALAQTRAAAQDANAPLPSVPVWADELRVARGLPPETAGQADANEKAPPAKPKASAEQRAAAAQAVQAGVMLLEQAVTAGHTKNTHSAAAALRQALKTHGRLVDDALAARVHAALVSAGELEGWQRWSADQLREQLVAKAEALLVKRRVKGAPAKAAKAAAAAPTADAAETAGAAEAAPTPAAPGTPPAEVPAVTPDAIESIASQAENTDQTAENTEETVTPQAAPPAEDEGWETVPAVSGRKLQDTLRKLREEWKAADQGGAPNHALWKRFDRACNEAHRFVEQWLDKVRTEAAAHKAERQALIDEVKAWGAAQAKAIQAGGAQARTDWKAFGRQIHQFSERWRAAGHLSEKAFAELQPLWKEAIHTAAAPLEAAQKQSMARRQALIEEAQTLGAAPSLRVDAVKALQQRWQAEAQAVPLERKHETRLWDAFRKPIDDAFNRKSAEREKQQAATSAHDQAVLAAAQALEAANASGDAAQIRAAMTALEAALRGQPAATPASAPATEAAPADAAASSGQAAADAAPAPAESAADGAAGADTAPPAPAPQSAAAPAKPLIAMRGDDRPGMKKAEPAAPARGGKPGAGRGDARGAGRDRAGERGSRPDRGERGERGQRHDRAPRLGDTAFRAQRHALDQAQATLKKLAAQAHGEALAQLLGAWQQRDAAQLPSAQELGRGVTGATRSAWAQAIGAAPAGNPAAEALLRLEMAAEVPTPAEHLDARRALQLQLLTRRNDPAPAATWAQDTAAVFAAAHDEASARRLQSALKALLRKG